MTDSNLAATSARWLVMLLLTITVKSSFVSSYYSYSGVNAAARLSYTSPHAWTRSGRGHPGQVSGYPQNHHARTSDSRLLLAHTNTVTPEASPVQNSLKTEANVASEMLENNDAEAENTPKTTKVKKAAAKRTRKVKDDTGVAVKKPAVKTLKLSAGELDRLQSGYQFDMFDGVLQDVPTIDEPMWFRLQVRKNSERRIYDLLKSRGSLIVKNQTENASETTPISEQSSEDSDAFNNKPLPVAAVYYPSTYSVAAKGKGIELGSKAMVPGFLFVKTKMSPALAEEISSISGIYGLSKTNSGLVLPLDKSQAEQVEQNAQQPIPQLSESQQRIRKGEFVKVVSGSMAGAFGVFLGMQKGKLEIQLKSELTEDREMFDIEEVDYLEELPENDTLQEMSAAEALQSLMVKDPRNKLIRQLKQEGLLNSILNPQSSLPSNSDYNNAPFDGSGKRIRSIAIEKPKQIDSEIRKSSQFSLDAVNENVIAIENEPIKADLPSNNNKPWSKSKGPLQRKTGFSESEYAFESVSRKLNAGNPNLNLNLNENDNSFAFDSFRSDYGKKPVQSKEPIKSSDPQLDSFFDDLMSGLDAETKTNTPAKSTKPNVITNTNTEQYLDDLLQGLNIDTTTNSAPRKAKTQKLDSIADDFNLDELFSQSDSSAMFSGINNSGNNKKGKSITTAGAKTTKKVANGAPQMDQFESFDEYLDALMNYEKADGKAFTAGQKSSAEVRKTESSPVKKPTLSPAESNIDETEALDFNFDDDLLKLLDEL